MNSMFNSKRIWTLGVLFAVFAAFAMASSSMAGKVGYYQDAGDVKYVSTPDTFVQSRGVACQDAVGNVYVGWIKDGQVYAQKMAATDNSRQWGPNGLVALNDVQLTNPITIDLTFDGTYLWVAVLDRTTEKDDVQVQSIASNGALLVPSPWRRIVNEKSGDPTAIQDCVRIAADGQGGVVVALHAVVDDSVYISRLETDGSFTYTPMISTNLPVDDCYLKLLRGNAGNMWVASANATDIYVKSYSAVGFGSSELTGGWGWANNSEFWTVPNGSGGIVAVADNGDGDTKIYGLASSGSLYTETTVNGTVPTAATALEAGGQYVAFLTDDGNVHKYEIDTDKFNKDADFPVDLVGAVVDNPRMGDLGSERIGISGYADGAGNDLYVQVLSEDGVTLFNDADDPTPVDADADEEITENLALFSGSGKAVVLFDDNNTAGDYDDGDTNDDDKATYLVAPFDSGEAADLRWTYGNGIQANPDVLDTAEANSTLTVDSGVVKNAGQVDAEDVKVSFYIVNTNDIADANAWNNEIAGVKKRKVDEQDIGDLDTGEEYDYGTSNYDVNIDQATVNQILQELGDDLYLCALVNEDKSINEENYFVITTNVTEFPATNLSCTDCPLEVHAPDFVPDTIDEDVPDVEAGDNVTLDEVEIGNIGDTEGTCNVGFFLSPDACLDMDDLDDPDEAVFLGSVDGVTIPASDSVKLDDVVLTIPLDSCEEEYYIYAVPDYEDLVGEWDEENNINCEEEEGRTNEFDVTGFPDIETACTWFWDTDVQPGDDIDFEFCYTNVGCECIYFDCCGMTYEVYLSDDNVLDGNDTLLLRGKTPDFYDHYYYYYWYLCTGDCYCQTSTVQIPEGNGAGTWYIIIDVDTENVVEEFDETNNTAFFEIEIQAPDLPDLTIPVLASTEEEMTAASGGGLNVAKVVGVEPGAEIPVRFTAANEGSAASGLTKVVAYFTDDPNSPDLDDIFYVEVLGVLQPDGFVTFETTLTVPEDAAGEYYIVAVADPENLVKESDEDNNSAQKTVIVDLLVPSIDAHYVGGVVSLDLDLDVAGDYEGQPVDLWLAALAFDQMYYYSSGIWYSTPVPFMQTYLTSMVSTIEFPIVLPAGTYVFYFGLDDQNGAVDPDVLYDFDTLFVW